MRAVGEIINIKKNGKEFGVRVGNAQVNIQHGLQLDKPFRIERYGGFGITFARSTDSPRIRNFSFRL